MGFEIFKHGIAGRPESDGNICIFTFITQYLSIKWHDYNFQLFYNIQDIKHIILYQSNFIIIFRNNIFDYRICITL